MGSSKGGRTGDWGRHSGSVESRTTGIHDWPHVSDNFGAVPFESVIDVERGEISIDESQIGTIPERYRRICW